MENLRYDLEKPVKRSKYLGLNVQGWKIIRATRTSYNNVRFFFRKEFRDNRRHFDMTFTALDKEVRKLLRGKDINELIANKTVQVHVRHSNVFQNTIMCQFLK